MTQKTIVTAIFHDPDAARRAWTALEQSRIAERRLSWLMSRDVHERLMGGAPPANGADHTAEGAFAGALSGSTASLLAALSIAAGGPLAAIVAAGLGAAGGGLLGALVGAGIPRGSASRISDALPDGAIVVGVEVGDDDELSQVRSILERHGAASRSETPTSATLPTERADDAPAQRAASRV